MHGVREGVCVCVCLSVWLCVCVCIVMTAYENFLGASDKILETGVFSGEPRDIKTRIENQGI